jgi:hypothetical protein
VSAYLGNSYVGYGCETALTGARNDEIGAPDVNEELRDAYFLLLDLPDSGVANEPIEALLLGRHAVDLLVKAFSFSRSRLNRFTSL